MPKYKANLGGFSILQNTTLTIVNIGSKALMDAIAEIGMTDVDGLFTGYLVDSQSLKDLSNEYNKQDDSMIGEELLEILHSTRSEYYLFNNDA